MPSEGSVIDSRSNLMNKLRFFTFAISVFLLASSATQAGFTKCRQKVVAVYHDARRLQNPFAPQEIISTPIHFHPNGQFLLGGTIFLDQSAGAIWAWSLRDLQAQQLLKAPKHIVGLQAGRSSGGLEVGIHFAEGEWSIYHNETQDGKVHDGLRLKSVLSAKPVFAPATHIEMLEGGRRMFIASDLSAEMWDTAGDKRLFTFPSPFEDDEDAQSHALDKYSDPKGEAKPISALEMAAYAMIGRQKYVMGIFGYSKKVRIWDAKNSGLLFEGDRGDGFKPGRAPFIRPSNFGTEYATIQISPEDLPRAIAENSLGEYRSKVEIWRFTPPEQNQEERHELITTFLTDAMRMRPLIEFLPEGRVAVTIGQTTFSIYDMYNKKFEQVEANGPDVQLSHMTTTPDGRLVTAGHDGSIVFWDFVRGRAQRIVGENVPIFSLQISPDNDKFLVQTNSALEQNNLIMVRGGTDGIRANSYLFEVP
jgi:WD40 repeat protein